jgi:glycosyltransferase involved in cell wall biosynthesis
VRLTGYLSDGRLDAVMRGADALIHPSLYEGFGLVLVEAMARGVPVVAARATALPETGGDAAEYFDPLDTGDMANAIRAVVGDRERHEELKRLGAARAKGLSWADSAALTAAVYEEMLL